MAPPANRNIFRRFLLAGTGIALIALSACAQRSETTGSVNPSASSSAIAVDPNGDLAEATRYWQEKFESNPSDRAAGINLARHLRASGRAAEAVGPMRQLSIAYPGDAGVMRELGKTLAASGSLDDALRVLDQVIAKNSADWQLHSIRGTVLDQMDRGEEAQTAYQAALQIAPGEPDVLSNLGLSYALGGDLTRAEQVLRQALDHPRATAKVRENLALVLGLQGRFEEAEQIAAAGQMQPAAVASNTAYLRNMMSQPDRWSQLQQN
jgi:Flp pilus assembly protein TadD